MHATSRFKRWILRAVLRDVYPMVIRLVAVPDCLDLADFDDICRGGTVKLREWLVG